MYKSKREIFDDYQIALKLQIEPVGIRIQDYNDLLQKLNNNDKLILQDILGIENYKTKYPLSRGIFVEVQVKTDSVKDIGVRNLILKHESGIELFWMVVGFLANNPIAQKFGDAIYKEVAKKSLDKIIEHAQKWYQSKGHKIVYIEIRTPKKGIMRLDFKDFNMSQFECLMDNFHSVNHLSQLNQSCFKGKLIDTEEDKSITNAMTD